MPSSMSNPIVVVTAAAWSRSARTAAGRAVPDSGMRMKVSPGFFAADRRRSLSGRPLEVALNGFLITFGKHPRLVKLQLVPTESARVALVEPDATLSGPDTATARARPGSTPRYRQHPNINCATTFPGVLGRRRLLGRSPGTLLLSGVAALGWVTSRGVVGDSTGVHLGSRNDRNLLALLG